jgi:hypothetical protein
MGVLQLKGLRSLAVTKHMPLQVRNLCNASAVATLQLCVGVCLILVVVTLKYFLDRHNTAKLGFNVS